MKAFSRVIPLAIGLVVVGLSPVAGAQRPTAVISLSPESNHPRGTVTIKGTGFGPNETIDITFDDQQFATAATNGSGRFSTRFRVPANATPATHTVEAIGETSGIRDNAAFLVNTNWLGYWFNGSNNRVNPYENVLNQSNVSNLINAWTFTGTTFFNGSAAVVDGVLYQGSYGNEGGSLYALDAVTGAQLWRVSMDVWRAPSVVGGKVYVMSVGDQFAPDSINALDASDGSTIWSVPVDHFDSNAPTVTGGVVYVGSTDHHVYAFDAETGAKRWATGLGAAVSTPPAVVGGVVYVGTGLSTAVALDAATGAILWSAPLGGVVKYSAPTVSNGVVYIGAQDDQVYALDAASGAQLWTFTTAGWDESSPIVSNGIVYVQSYYDHLYALEAATGTLRWEFSAGNAQGSPAVANGVVYVSDYGGQVYALNAVTGTELWSYDIGSFIDSSPVVVNGMVYVGTNGYQIFAFTLP